MFFGGLSGSSVSTAVNLGIDDTVGRPRRRPRMAPKHQQRKKGMRIKVKRISKARAVLGRHARKMFVSGGLAAVSYGSEVHGGSDQEIPRVQGLPLGAERRGQEWGMRRAARLLLPPPPA